jgi:phage terminase large subunit
VNVEINTTITYEHLLDAKHRITQHIGGTRSGKTYAILQYLLTEAIQNALTVTIVRKTIPSLKRTVIKDFKDILTNLNLWRDENFNITDRVYHLYNSSVQFLSTDDADKLRGIKSDILFIDEASEIDEESYFQLSIRTTGRIILAYNPTISPYHWLRQMVDVERYVTTYKDNVYLEPAIIKAIEELEIKNPKYWKIYGKGEFAPNDKAVFQFEVVDDWNDNPNSFGAEFVAFGMDFGFSSDPSSLVAVYKNGDNIWVEELMYDKGLVTKDIADKLNSFDITKSEEIWCDSAEPRLVEELYRMGFNAKPVKKGPDSIKFGIGVLNNYKIHINKKSQNLINEMYAYQYSTDKHGYTTDVPEGGLDHLIDALRYVAMMKLSQKAVGKGKYVISIS